MTKKTKTTTSKKEKRFDLKQSMFLKLYLTPGTKYFNNALQSALKAGYAREYSENILQGDLKWLKQGMSEIIGRSTDKKNLVAKAKRVLDRSLDSKNEALAQDTAKFIVKTDPEFSSKQDVNHHFPVPIYGGKSKIEPEEDEV